jgi:Cu2+-exporting ATPase
VLVQRLDAIEGLARIDRLFIDKTGTLTEARPRLLATHLLSPGPGVADEAEARVLGASLAAWSHHPLSTALAAGGDNTGPAWTRIEEQVGQGLRAEDPQGLEWRLGSAAWVGATPASAGDAAEVWLGCAGRALARFEFDEALREGATEALAALQRDGVKLTLLSGDAPERAERLAQRFRFDAVIGGATPEAKLAAVAAAQARGEFVAMVGDGVNDAPVLSRADVSLAMGQGALVSRAQADAVLVSNRPLDIVRARDTARHAMRIVRQNLAWAALYNAACIPLALAGLLPPWAAGIGMASSSLVVVLNALRAAR